MRMLERLAAVLKVSGRTLLPATRLMGPDPDATVPAYLFNFDAALLFRHRDELASPLARLMMATDDIRHLRKLLIVHPASSDATTTEKAMGEGEIGHLFRLLCGHLFEGIGAFADLDKCQGLLDASVLTPQSELERRRATTALENARRTNAEVFSKKGRRHFIAIVRNLVSFHYPDDQKLKRTLAKHLWHGRSTDRLAGRLVVAAAQGIGRYSVTDDMVKRVLRDEVGGSAADFARKYMEAIGQALDMAQSLIDVVDFLIAHLLTTYRIPTEAVADVIRIDPRIVRERKRMKQESSREHDDEQEENTR